MNDVAPPDIVPRGALWFGLLGGAVAWTLHLMLAYGIAEFGYVSGVGRQNYGGLSLVAWLVLALTAAATLLGLSATIVAYRWQQRLPPPQEGEDNAVATERSTARTGWLTSGIFTFVILFESIPILFFLHGC